MATFGPCIGVKPGCRDGRSLTLHTARWCMRCGGGPYCSECLEGHQVGHREIDAEQAANLKYPDGRYRNAALKAWAQPGAREKRVAAMRHPEVRAKRKARKALS